VVAGVTFSDSHTTPVPKLLNSHAAPKFFKFENSNLVQTPANIDATEFQQRLELSNDIYKNYTDTCKLLPKKGDSGSGLGLHKFWTHVPKKRSILPDSTPVIRINSHLNIRLGTRQEFSRHCGAMGAQFAACLP